MTGFTLPQKHGLFKKILPMLKFRSDKIIYIACTLIILIFFLHLNQPLQGILKVRQADTLMSGWSMCVEKTNPFKPKIAHRDDTEGIAIGELPIASWYFASSCFLTSSWSEWAIKLQVLILYIGLIAIWGLVIKKKIFCRMVRLVLFYSFFRFEHTFASNLFNRFTRVTGTAFYRPCRLLQ